MSPKRPDETPREEHLRAIFQHGLQFAGLVSPDGILLETNPASLVFIGATRSEVVGRPFSETPWWETEAQRERLRDAIRSAAGGERVRYEIRATGAAGEPAVFDFSLVPVPGPDGGIRALVAEAREITALHRAREALRASEARLAAIVGGTLDAIVSVDEEQRIRLFNEGAERIFGYEADEVLGERLDVLIPETFRAAHGGLVREFGDGPETARRMGERGEIFGRRKDGEVFPAEASISKATVEGRRVFTVVLRDVTERREIERERARLAEVQRQARVDAEAATRARDDMLRVVSHDLQNPVTGVLMGARMLRYQLESDHPGLEILEGIELAAGRQGRLIRDLSDVASIEAGRLSVERRPADVAAIVRGAVRPFESVAAVEGVGLVWEVPDALPKILADRDRIAQVLSNLLDNALEVTPAGGRVSIDAAAAEDDVRIRVRDTGPGISAEERELVFERFWRGSGGRRAGSGLGLAIARGIVESHGGRIWVESAPGEGSAFHFTVPVAGNEPSVPSHRET